MVKTVLFQKRRQTLIFLPSTEGASVRDDFLDGICEGPGAPGRLMRLAGPLGSGRTTLLGDLARIAEDEGWQAIKISNSQEPG